MTRKRPLLGWAGLLLLGACSAPTVQWGDPAAWREALPELRARVEADSTDQAARAHLALALLYDERAAAADSLAAVVLEDAPRDALAWYVTAVACERRGEWARADSIYRRRESFADAPRGLPEIMAARQGVALREVLRRQLRADLDRARRDQGLALEPLALVVYPFAPIGEGRPDSVLAVGVTHYLTNTFALIDTLVVIDNTRRHLLEEEIRQSQSEAFQSSTRLVARTIGASLAVRGHVGRSVEDDEAARVQYGIEDLLLERADPSYRGTAAPVELTSPTRYLLADLGEQVARIAEDRLGLELAEPVRARLVRPRTGEFDAFLAYAEGLYWEERYRYGLARDAFREAQRIDPGFDDAREAAERTRGGAADLAPPPAGPAVPVPGSDLAEEAGAGAGRDVDQMPEDRAEEPTPVPAAVGEKVRIIVHPR